MIALFIQNSLLDVHRTCRCRLGTLVYAHDNGVNYRAFMRMVDEWVLVRMFVNLSTTSDSVGHKENHGESKCGHPLSKSEGEASADCVRIGDGVEV